MPVTSMQFPTKDNPNAVFNYFQFIVTRNLDLKVHNRKTYSLLDWLGDVGGLLDGMYLIVELLIAGYSACSLEAYLAQALVWVSSSA